MANSLERRIRLFIWAPNPDGPDSETCLVSLRGHLTISFRDGLWEATDLHAPEYGTAKAEDNQAAMLLWMAQRLHVKLK